MRLMLTALALIALGVGCGRMMDRPGRRGAGNIGGVTDYTPASPKEAEMPGLEYHTLKSGKHTRSYYIKRPRKAPDNKKLPIIIGLHGGGKGGKTKGGVFAGSTRLRNEVDARGFIGVFPNGVEGSWWAPNFKLDGAHTDDQFIVDLIEEVVKKHGGDPNQVAFTGFSAGGHYSQYLACAHSDRVKAIGVVGATTGRGVLDSLCKGERKVPTLMILGSQDETNPPSGGTLKRSGAPVCAWEESVEFYAKKNNCKERKASKYLPDRAADGIRVRRESFERCDAPLEFLMVEGGGHSWPGSTNKDDHCEDIRATDVILDFFKANGLDIK